MGCAVGQAPVSLLGFGILAMVDTIVHFIRVDVRKTILNFLTNSRSSQSFIDK